MIRQEQVTDLSLLFTHCHCECDSECVTLSLLLRLTAVLQLHLDFLIVTVPGTGLEIRPFLQSGSAKICAGMVRFVISHYEELANLRPS